MTTAPKLIREQLLALAAKWRITQHNIGQGSAGNKARRQCADQLEDIARSLAAEPVGGRAIQRYKVVIEGRKDQCWGAFLSPDPDGDLCKFADIAMAQFFAELTAQPDSAEGEPWRPINELPNTDDLFWFARGNTVDGPRSPEPDDWDRWDWFASCTWPSLAKIRATDEGMGGYIRCDCSCPNGLKHLPEAHDTNCAGQPKAEGGEAQQCATKDFFAVSNKLSRPQPEQPIGPYDGVFDDRAVDTFAAAMKLKLADARAKGRSGWWDKDDLYHADLCQMLRAHVEKGDPRDVANFCMFLHQRGESILPQQADGGAVYQYRYQSIAAGWSKWIECEKEQYDQLSGSMAVEDGITQLRTLYAAHQPKSPGVGADQQREQFERWALPQGYRLTRRDMQGSARLGQYCDDNTQIAWEAWRAGLAALGD